MDNFVVSARKYRPATFASVVGQGHITSTLVNAISRGQLAHAYLFCGPRGVGKTTCARIFAKAINCMSPVDNEACDNCDSCRGFNESRSFNIHELDAASNNSVDDIRTLTEQVRIPPQIGQYSVYIIDEVHMLSAQAFNAFLKTLEEPPAHAIFILATTEKHKIIPTILSRCQIFDFNRIRVEDGVGYLKYIASKEGVSYDEESLNLIASKADGGMRDALSMFDKAVSFCGTELNYKSVAQAMNVLDYDTYFSLVDLLLEGDYTKCLLAFDQVLSKGFSGLIFLSGLNSHFRDLLMAKSPQTIALLEVTASLLEKYKAQAAKCDTAFIFSAISLLTEIDGTLRTATNQRLNIELGLMKLCRLGQKKNNDGGSLSINEVFELPELVKPSVPTKQVSTDKIEVQKIESQQKEQREDATTKVTQNIAPQERQQPARPAESIPSISVSGLSINSLLNSKPGDVVQDQGEEQKAENIDPQSEDKINKTIERFTQRLTKERPRMGMAFRDMKVSGNLVTVIVPSQALREEILRNQTEVLTLLAVEAQVSGVIGLEVQVVETVQDIAPIKVEDKLKFLVEKNPLLNKLRKQIELDIE